MIDEPEITLEDTSPTMATQRLLSENWPPRDQKRSGQGPRIVAGLVLLGALVLTIAATFIWLDFEESASSQAPDALVEQPAPDNVSDAGAASSDAGVAIADTSTIQAENNAPGQISAPAAADQGDSGAPVVVSPPEPAAADQGQPDGGQPVVQEATPVPTMTPFPSMSEPSAPQPGVPVDDPANPALYPTPDVNAITAALLAPVPTEPPSGIIRRDSAPFTIRTGQSRAAMTVYTVQQGDSLEGIAAKFGLSDIYSIVWSNSGKQYNPLRPGVQLNIPPEDGIYYQVSDNVTLRQLADTFKVDPYTIIDAEYNPELYGTSPDTLLVEGMAIVIPGGESERMLLLPANTSGGAGGGTSGGAVSGTYSLWGCTANVSGGSPPYTRPLSDYTWMQGFTPRYHEAVDLAAYSGSPVYAAGAGTVVYAGWSSGGYGNVVVLAHGSTFTLYAHLSAYKVSCNQQVSAGQVIGNVGTTGNSSGDHLHFEIRDADFNAMNPQNYISF